ncbi:dimethyl sulfoxide reductase anchor subunit family protein [Photobacterium iliopiscarium]|jgi:anaerobic dimethyl sulfoxide reductase subunit C (anchor subunit)|uniref:Dimethyl sulfoxide reductase n=1 Tax=Photobacterium iliopiscarium TaxID=56192 RepID=A0A2T3MLD7_9GAMM|nr:DmsC/YnfH family molybdoenzyme membrane anchor subunit [Photobacterium iliopiscarium]KJG12115.1 dimethyl sulfoxide reductase [Photobacterium iliopiscarium]PST99624.1 dimethyl sulfoxide reductase [Photobacterium iliopiscarium]PSV82948.1 dimethyl sulfoxide reductase [Photobacterium iliopiscarium]PSV97120.1 dimethyl sulfoxide reductase [Photobacterium iliopiscarium]
MLYPELPLVVFTVLAQTAVGGYITMAGRLSQMDSIAKQRQPLVLSMFILWAFMAIGFAASTMHLGSPLRAFNALNRVGYSGLSNEILTGSLFFALGGIYWLAELFKIANAHLLKIARLVVSIAGVIFMAAMIKVYLINTVPVWDSSFTYVEFIGTVLMSGVLLGYVLLNLTGATTPTLNAKLATFGVVIISLHLVITAWQLVNIAEITTSIQTGAEHLAIYSGSIITRLLLLVIAGGLWLFSAFKSSQTTSVTALSGLAFVIMFAAEIIGRGVFYGLHFTVGLL